MCSHLSTNLFSNIDFLRASSQHCSCPRTRASYARRRQRGAPQGPACRLTACGSRAPEPVTGLPPCTQGCSGSLTPGPGTDPSLTRNPHATVGSGEQRHESIPQTCGGPRSGGAASLPTRCHIGSSGNMWACRDEHRETPARTGTGPVPTSCQPQLSCPSVPGPPMPEPG